MPLLDTNMEQHTIGGTTYGFSAAKIDSLGATEYTLVGLVVDRSGSVTGFERDEEGCIKEIVAACRKSPRADNLMLRFVRFDSLIEEVHGFKPLALCNPDDYGNTLQARGTTALCDASFNVVESVVQYGRDLTKSDFQVNAIMFVVTDGLENASKMTAGAVRKSIEGAVKSEALESVVTILIGVNIGDPMVSGALQAFAKGAGFTQYIEIQSANAESLAKLAQFISKSISSQSQALGSGGPSKTLTF